MRSRRMLRRLRDWDRALRIAGIIGGGLFSGTGVEFLEEGGFGEESIGEDGEFIGREGEVWHGRGVSPCILWGKTAKVSRVSLLYNV